MRKLLAFLDRLQARPEMPDGLTVSDWNHLPVTYVPWITEIVGMPNLCDIIKQREVWHQVFQQLIVKMDLFEYMQMILIMMICAGCVWLYDKLNILKAKIE